jgi:UDP-N-acetyl-D-galactosamine dehydrogenase
MSVLEAAGTKWNFLPFRPGLVGGHCIGVDPYYLTHKAQEVGHHPEIIMAGRRINDLMGELVAARFVRALISKGIDASRARVLVLGITFKENCPDTRNTKVVDVVRELADYGMDVSIHDPWADGEEVEKEYGLRLSGEPVAQSYDGVIVAVSHDEFRNMGANGIRNYAKPNGVVFDVKGMLGIADSDLRL